MGIEPVTIHPEGKRVRVSLKEALVMKGAAGTIRNDMHDAVVVYEKIRKNHIRKVATNNRNKKRETWRSKNNAYRKAKEKLIQAFGTTGEFPTNTPAFKTIAEEYQYSPVGLIATLHRLGEVDIVRVVSGRNQAGVWGKYRIYVLKPPTPTQQGTEGEPACA